MYMESNSSSFLMLIHILLVQCPKTNIMTELLYSAKIYIRNVRNYLYFFHRCYLYVCLNSQSLLSTVESRNTTTNSFLKTACI